jgi:uncharacterized lipoprotein YajG
MYHKITTVCVICIVLLSGCRAKKNIVSTTPAKTTTTQISTTGAQQETEKKTANRFSSQKKSHQYC